MNSVSSISDEYEKACYYDKTLIPLLNEIREIVDALELLIDKNVWTLPSYYDLLFNL